jgi:hypothetical protein
MTERPAPYETNVPAVIGDTSRFDAMMRHADTLVRSGLLPAEIKTPAAALAVILTGQELGIPPMQALRSIYVVKGKPTLSAQLIGALILSRGHSYKINTSTAAECQITFTRAGGGTYTHAFTMADATTAGLAVSDTWKKYTKAMLFSRCMSAGARAFLPDVIAGMYTSEELADPETVTVDAETGECKVIEATISAPDIRPMLVEAEPCNSDPSPSQNEPSARLAPIAPTGNRGWWAELVKNAGPLGYDNHMHIINALVAEHWDQSAMDFGHRGDILECLRKRHQAQRQAKLSEADVSATIALIDKELPA